MREWFPLAQRRNGQRFLHCKEGFFPFAGQVENILFSPLVFNIGYGCWHYYAPVCRAVWGWFYSWHLQYNKTQNKTQTNHQTSVILLLFCSGFFFCLPLGALGAHSCRIPKPYSQGAFASSWRVFGWAFFRPKNTSFFADPVQNGWASGHDVNTCWVVMCLRWFICVYSLMYGVVNVQIEHLYRI